MSEKTIPEVIGINEEEYNKLFDRFHIEFAEAYRNTKTPTEFAEWLLEWFDAEQTPENMVRAVMIVKLFDTTIYRLSEIATKAAAMVELLKRTNEVNVLLAAMKKIVGKM